MLKFIDKIIDKIHNWIQKQERFCIEDSIKSLCSRIRDKYHDVTIKCYYDIYSPNTFILQINEKYNENTAFNEYLDREIEEIYNLFPEITVIYDHYNPINPLYYDNKVHKIIYEYE